MREEDVAVPRRRDTQNKICCLQVRTTVDIPCPKRDREVEHKQQNFGQRFESNKTSCCKIYSHGIVYYKRVNVLKEIDDTVRRPLNGNIELLLLA